MELMASAAEVDSLRFMVASLGCLDNVLCACSLQRILAFIERDSHTGGKQKARPSTARNSQLYQHDLSEKILDEKLTLT